MNDGVLLMNFGRKHLSHQLISLYSLRRFWSGPVAICCDADAAEPLQKVCDVDDGVRLILFEPYRRAELGDGAGYLNKTRLIELSPFARAVFFDADTIIVGKFPEIFPDDIEIRLTQFSDWVTTGNKVSARIRRWNDVLPAEVSVQISIPYPSINTGVLGLSKLSRRLSTAWQDATKKNVSFMCDELSMQLIFPAFPHVVLPDYFNASPIYSPGRPGFEAKRVRVWHGHGFKSIRSAAGLRLWLPVIFEMLENDKFGLRQSFQFNKYFERLAADPAAFCSKYGGDEICDLFSLSNRGL